MDQQALQSEPSLRRSKAVVAHLARRCLVHASDRGWLGLDPFDLHVVVCGFPRSGSTLLQSWLEAALPDAKVFGREKPALATARRLWPGRHRVMLTKRPADVLELEAIRQFYRGRPGGAKFVLTTRDPRAVLTSKHGDSEGYYVSAERWRAVAHAVEKHRADSDVLVVDYADVVLSPQRTQARIAAFLGRELAVPLASAHQTVPAGFDVTALNGVRPLDATRLNAWLSPIHAKRLALIHSVLPELDQYLSSHGYADQVVYRRA